MKTIVIYYSLEGSTAHIAKEIEKTIKCDMFVLEMVDPYSIVGIYSKALRDISSKETPELIEIPDIENYERVIICSPVWYHSCVPVFNTLFKSIDLSKKKVFIFSTSNSDTGNVLNKIKIKAKSMNAITYDFNEVVKTKCYKKEIKQLINKGGIL